jgi:hypothetical protein
MYEWIENEENIEVMQFCIEYKIPYMTLKDWTAKYPDIDKAYKDIKLMLASRRRVGATKRKYSESMILKDIHVYDPEWLAINRYNAELKNIEAQQGNILIEMHAAPVTGRVTPRVIAKEEPIEEK